MASTVQRRSSLDLITTMKLINHQDLWIFPRDAMLARHNAMFVCLCLSVTSRSSIETAERIELPSTCPTHRVIGLPGSSSTNFVSNSGLGNFCHDKSMVLSTKLVDGRACGPHLQLSRGQERIHTSVHCSPLTPLL